MKYFYLVSYLILNEGKILHGGSFLRTSENVISLKEMNHIIEHFYAGDPATYTEVVLLNVQRITQLEYEEYQPE